MNALALFTDQLQWGVERPPARHRPELISKGWECSWQFFLMLFISAVKSIAVIFSLLSFLDDFHPLAKQVFGSNFHLCNPL